jgi:Xaa-Pro aminopeptidase
MLEPGLVFTIELGVYLHSSFRVRVEDDMLVTEDGKRFLLKCRRIYLLSKV